MSAFSNRHYSVAVVTLAAILALILQPLCSTIFVLKDTWWGPDRQCPFFQLTVDVIANYLIIHSFLYHEPLCYQS